MMRQTSDASDDESPERRPLRITLAGESDLVTQGLGALLAPYDDLTLVPAGPGGGLATFVDLTLHDSFAHVPVCEGTIERLASRPAGGKLVVYSWNVQPELVNVALRKGAAGCLSKWLPTAELVDSLCRIADGHTVVRSVARERSSELEPAGLTTREAEVIGLIAAGLSNLEIACATGLSINSVKSYIRGAYRKIHPNTRSQAVLWAIRNGCVTEPSATTWPVAGDEVVAINAG